jgi:hypothetical protein
VVANLLEVIFDLSFRRRGALFIYDPRHQIRGHILNRESIVFSGWRTDVSVEAGAESGQAVIAPSLRDLAIGKNMEALRRKWRLIELAHVDGALVFDDDQLLAAGAIIESHPSAGDQLGARTTAARSAYLWGAYPVNVSSDGGGKSRWIWSGHDCCPIRFDTGQKPDNPPLAEVLVQGNVVYDPGRDAAPRAAPRYKYAVIVSKSPGGPKGLHFSNNLFHPGTAGVANVELKP